MEEKDEETCAWQIYGSDLLKQPVSWAMKIIIKLICMLNDLIRFFVILCHSSKQDCTEEASLREYSRERTLIQLVTVFYFE